MKKLFSYLVLCALVVVGLTSCNEDVVNLEVESLEAVTAPMSFAPYVEVNTDFGTKADVVRPSGIVKFVESMDVRIVNSNAPVEVTGNFNFVGETSAATVDLALDAYLGLNTVHIITDGLFDTPIDWYDYSATGAAAIVTADLTTQVAIYDANDVGNTVGTGWSCGRYVLNKITTIISDLGVVADEDAASYIAITKLRALNPYAPFKTVPAGVGVQHDVSNNDTDAKIPLTTNYGRVIGSIEFTEAFANTNYTVYCEKHIVSTGAHYNIPAVSTEGAWFYWSNTSADNGTEYYFTVKIIDVNNHTVRTLRSDADASTDANDNYVIVGGEDKWINFLIDATILTSGDINWEITTLWSDVNQDGVFN